MKTFKTTCALFLLSSMILLGCSKYVQDLNDYSLPFCEIGIPVDQKTLIKSTKEWGLTQRYVTLKPIPSQPGATGREYEFYISAGDKGGLESIEIEVCPKDALIPGSLTEFSKTFDPSKTGSYLVSGKIRPLKLDEKISIKATVKGRDRGGSSRTHTTSIYGFANTRQLYQSQGRPHQDLCQVTSTNPNQTQDILLSRLITTNNDFSYCACVHQRGTGTSTVCSSFPTNNGQTVNCNNLDLTYPPNTIVKWVKNNSNKRLSVLTPNNTRIMINPGQKVNYNGKLYGNWYTNLSQNVGAGGLRLTLGF